MVWHYPPPPPPPPWVAKYPPRRIANVWPSQALPAASPWMAIVLTCEVKRPVTFDVRPPVTPVAVIWKLSSGLSRPDRLATGGCWPRASDPVITRCGSTTNRHVRLGQAPEGGVEIVYH